MSNNQNIDSKFLEQAEVIISENLSNEQFGVSELAAAMNMSRSNLLRKIKKQTELSASQFIRKVRLEKGKELLKTSSLTISEISYQVGFGSTSYFIKCFREQYGYSPGEMSKQKQEEETISKPFTNKYWRPIIAVATLIILAIVFVNYTKKKIEPELKVEKSIAVLPFKNESNDSTNLYFVNGLMESALGNLQKIEDLRVISRTSVEKYRNTGVGIPEIAEELNVNYLVEGSGQRIGNKVLLNIQLIDASSDRPIWMQQYTREVKDVFALQNEIASKIAVSIKAIVTPAELEQIEKVPTENLIAYDYYLKALEPYYSRTKEGLDKAIPLFKKAIDNDPKFSLAYAHLSISYYYLDVFQNQKQYEEEINNYADKALLYDSKSDISLIAKALYYMYTSEYRLALPHLEKALEYNPNSASVIQVLTMIYSNYLPDTGKHLKYALMGNQIDIAANDSIGKSFIYLNLSNALIQNGFTDEAYAYIEKSLDYNPNNNYSPYLKTMILYAKNRDLKATTAQLKNEYQKDTTRLDILQEVAKFYYYQENYEKSYKYFNKFITIKEKNDLNIYPHENIKIGISYKKMGFEERGKHFLNAYADYCAEDNSIYKSASLAVKYAYEGKRDKAIEQLNIFVTKDNYQYWMLLFMRLDPVMKSIKDHPQYNEVMEKIENHFKENQSNLRRTLEAKNLI
ncbi:helix-turn-helix domain-containing protein [Aurantibacter sp.]|uniref:helix-turn-helix domain-containing protein n=1 Tax=Aurantibacter sp. TaxID=2807103 RepID=UPI003265CF3C